MTNTGKKNIFKDRKAASLLIVLVILGTLTATAVGIATVFRTEIIVSGLSDDSISAILAADAGMEKKLFDIRQLNGSVATSYSATLSNGASYQTCPSTSCVAGPINTVFSEGTFRATKRALETTY